MEIRHLRYFIAVAQELSITGAAKKLHIAQPPLTRQIQQLETELGVQLIDRSSRKIKLTPAGQYFYSHALNAIEHLEVTIEATRRIASQQRERFSIGFSLMTLNGVLPAVIRSFGESFPHLDISLCDLSSTQQIEALKSGRIDVGFGRMHPTDDAISSELLINEPLSVALSANNPLASSDQLALRALSNEPYILYPAAVRPSFADYVLALFHRRGLSLNIRTEANSLHAAIGMVSAGFGVTLVPRSMQDLHLNGVAYRTLADADVYSPVLMSYRKRAAHSGESGSKADSTLDSLRTHLLAAIKQQT